MFCLELATLALLACQTLIPLVGLYEKPMVGNGFPAAQTILSCWLQSETYWMWFKGEPMRQHVCMYINIIRTYLILYI
jgi:hypothetical protein